METIETATTHDEPTFVKHGVIHYAVGNIPGAVAKTSTLALANVTLGYVMKIANMGWKEAFKADSSLAKGANVIGGNITYSALAETYGMKYVDIKDIVSMVSCK